MRYFTDSEQTRQKNLGQNIFDLNICALRKAL